MSKIAIKNRTESQFVQISNIFIDEYMPQANGTYVKVYLLLLKTMNSGNSNISVSCIADRLWLTENDVIRSFKYWEKSGLLDISFDSEGNITELSLNKPASKKGSNEKTNTVSSLKKEAEPENISEKDALPDYNRTYTGLEMAKVADNEEFSFLATIVEKYMEQSLSPSDVELIVYLYDNLRFSTDLILHLYEYCISRGKKNPKYIQTVAIDWDKHGIDTVEKAISYSASYISDYMDIMRVFGLSQPPAPVQVKLIDSWYEMGFNLEMIKEACNRTILAINEPSFNYANGILERWKIDGVKTKNDLKAHDEKHNTKKESKRRSAAAKTKNTFNSYEQRQYSGEDYNALEQLLSR